MRWAHRVAGRFPDGILHVNLRGFDPGGQALEPAEAIRGSRPGLLCVGGSVRLAA